MKDNITDYIFINDTDQSGDVALVFGTWNAWKGSVEKAVVLYKDKLVPKIIFSGGVNNKTSIVEARAMADEAMRMGVPKSDILIEDKSTNTLENVLFSIKILDKEIGLENIKVITAIVKNYHARRALMTLRKHVSAKIQLKSAAYTSPFYDFTKENWAQSKLGKEKVLEEVEKIEKYLAKGDLAEL